MFRYNFKNPSNFVLTLFCLMGWTTHAQAYFDPVTGSMVLQLLLASVLGFLFTLKTYLGKFKDFFKNLVDKNSTDDYKN